MDISNQVLICYGSCGKNATVTLPYTYSTLNYAVSLLAASDALTNSGVTITLINSCSTFITHSNHTRVYYITVGY